MLMSVSEKPVVVITGISDFLGSHVCLEFLKNEGFEVRGIIKEQWHKSILKKPLGKYYEII